jgi:hypothetical protein
MEEPNLQCQSLNQRNMVMLEQAVAEDGTIYGEYSKGNQHGEIMLRDIPRMTICKCHVDDVSIEMWEQSCDAAMTFASQPFEARHCSHYMCIQKGTFPEASLSKPTCRA